MKLQVYSDLHLEFYKTYPKIEPLAEVLFLAGDIGKINNNLQSNINYKEFFDYVSNNWKYCFYVLGNHEYYHCKKNYLKLNKEYKEFFNNYNNVHLLDKDYCILDDILILGCTMWTKNDNQIVDIINDFNHIKIKKDNRTVNIDIETFNNLHQLDKDFIFDTLSKNLENIKQIIILTHYPLIQENTSNPIFINQPEYLKNYFANNMHSNIHSNIHSNMHSNNNNNNNIKLTIISGHTHYSYYFKKDNITYISNQFGYKSEINNSNLKVDGLFEI